MLAMLQVRGADWIKLPSGEFVSANALLPLFKVEDALWQWQVVQESETRVRVLLVTGAHADREAMRQVIGDGVQRLLGDEVRVEVESVDAVEHTAGGKVRKVVSRLDDAGQQWNRLETEGDDV